MKISDVISNFDLVCEDPSGISKLRTLFVELAIKGGLDHHSSRDQNGYPSHWRIMPANEVLDSRSGNSKLIKGKLHDRPLEGTFPGYSASGQDVWLDHWEHDGTAAILSAVGARCGKAFLAKGKWSAIANTHIIWISEPNFLPEYAMLILNNESFWIRSGTAQPFVKVKATLEKIIAVPPIEEQHLILQKVSDFMQKCNQFENLRDHRNRLLSISRESVISAISTSQNQLELRIAWERIQSNWEILVDTTESMEPIKLLIHDLATKGILTGGRNFEEVALKDIAEISYGYTESATKSEVGPKFLRITDIQYGKVNWDTVPFCPISNSGENKHLLKDGDLVFARTGATTGKSFLLKDPPRSVCASYLIRVRPNLRKVLPDYLYLYFQSGQYWTDVKSGMSGTAQGGFNSSKLGELAIRIPDLGIQAEIVNRAIELLQVCETLSDLLSRRQKLVQKFTESVIRELA